MSFCETLCKQNYAATVQTIMPAEVRPERLAGRDMRTVFAAWRVKSASECGFGIDSGL